MSEELLNAQEKATISKHLAALANAIISTDMRDDATYTHMEIDTYGHKEGKVLLRIKPYHEGSMPAPYATQAEGALAAYIVAAGTASVAAGLGARGLFLSQPPVLATVPGSGVGIEFGSLMDMKICLNAAIELVNEKTIGQSVTIEELRSHRYIEELKSHRYIGPLEFQLSSAAKMVGGDKVGLLIGTKADGTGATLSILSGGTEKGKEVSGLLVGFLNGRLAKDDFAPLPTVKTESNNTMSTLEFDSVDDLRRAMELLIAQKHEGRNGERIMGV